MGKNKGKNINETEKIEEGEIENQEGTQKEIESSKDQKSKMTQSTKAIIIILIAAILVLTVFLAFSLGKRAGDKKPIDILTEDEVKPAGNTTGMPSGQNADSVPVVSDNTGALTADTVPEATDTVEEKKADLYVVEYYFSEDPKMGEEFTVKIKVGNKGKATAKDFHWEWWSNAYGKSCEGEIDSLAVGEVKKVECDYTYGGWSTYATKAVVDSKYDVDESNEGNNIATKEVVPIHDQKADLYVSEYTFNHPPVMGEAFTISIKIKNKGDGDAGSFWWEWWPTWAAKACREEVDGIDANESETVTCTYTYGGWANYATKAVVDADNDISESDESNNTYTQNVIPIH